MPSISIQSGWDITPQRTVKPRQRPFSHRPHTNLIAILRQTISDWMADNCPKLAAALACYAVLSLAPLVVILFKLVSVALHDDAARQLITDQLHNLMGSASSSELVDSILKSSKQRTGTVATLIGVGILLFGASGVFGELQSSMNLIWEVKPKPHGGVWAWLRARFLSMAMVLGLGFLMLVSLVVSTVLTTAARWLGDGALLGIGLDVALSLVTITLMMAVIFKWLPVVKILWRDVWLGAFVTAVLFLLGKWGLALYFQYAAPSSAYGLFGSLAAVVIWVYYAAQILFFGAEFTEVYAAMHGRKLRPDAHAVAMDLRKDASGRR